jgi:hypothetical protein
MGMAGFLDFMDFLWSERPDSNRRNSAGPAAEPGRAETQFKGDGNGNPGRATLGTGAPQRLDVVLGAGDRSGAAAPDRGVQLAGLSRPDPMPGSNQRVGNRAQGTGRAHTLSASIRGGRSGLRQRRQPAILCSVCHLLK